MFLGVDGVYVLGIEYRSTHMAGKLCSIELLSSVPGINFDVRAQLSEIFP